MSWVLRALSVARVAARLGVRRPTRSASAVERSHVLPSCPSGEAPRPVGETCILALECGVGTGLEVAVCQMPAARSRGGTVTALVLAVSGRLPSRAPLRARRREPSWSPCAASARRKAVGSADEMLVGAAQKRSAPEWSVTGAPASSRRSSAVDQAWSALRRDRSRERSASTRAGTVSSSRAMRVRYREIQVSVCCAPWWAEAWVPAPAAPASGATIGSRYSVACTARKRGVRFTCRSHRVVVGRVGDDGEQNGTS